MRRHTLLTCSVLVSTLIVCAVPAADAAVIFADDFEADALGLNASLLNWTVSDGTIDVVGPATFPGLCDPPSGSSPTPARCVDMDGSSSNAGRITSPVIAFTPGSYAFSFWVAGNQRGFPLDRMTLTIGSLFSGGGNLSSSDPWQQLVFLLTVSAPESAAIVFDHVGGDNVGMLIDNVLLERIDPVPEPASLILVGFGLVGVELRRRCHTRR